MQVYYCALGLNCISFIHNTIAQKYSDYSKGFQTEKAYVTHMYNHIEIFMDRKKNTAKWFEKLNNF